MITLLYDFSLTGRRLVFVSRKHRIYSQKVYCLSDYLLAIMYVAYGLVTQFLFLVTILDKEELASAEVFFVSKDVAKLKSIKRSLESTRINIYWTEKQLPTVTSWLNENQSSWSKKP